MDFYYLIVLNKALFDLLSYSILSISLLIYVACYYCFLSAFSSFKSNYLIYKYAF